MSVIQEIASEESKMEMTPMIDVTFLLLIFFMCTIKFKTLEGKLAAYLPKDEGQSIIEDEPIDKLEITIEVAKAGQEVDAPGGGFVLVGHQASYKIARQTFASDPQSMDQMRSALATLRRADSQRAVKLKPMPGVVYADVVPMLDMLLEVGYEDVTFTGSFGKN